MIQFIFNLFITILEVATNLIIIPIMETINNYMPNIGNALTNVSNLFNHLGQYNTFILSYTGLYDATIFIIVSILVGCIVIPINVHLIKMVAKWWETLI